MALLSKSLLKWHSFIDPLLWRLFVVNNFIVAISLLLFAPTFVFFLEILAGVIRGWMPLVGGQKRLKRDSVLILMPAHNEECVIKDTLEAMRSHLISGDEVLVVADNCTDQTASIVRNLGFTVAERFNSNLRGKGYALDHGVRVLEARANPPAWVVILDADCRLHEGALDALLAAVQLRNRPAQAVYLMENDPSNKAVSPLAVFAWRVRNLVRPMGLQALGGPSHLTGSGMAFSWEQLRGLPLASGQIVEDMKMGVDLALAGHPPFLVTEALVTSTFPVSKEGAIAQRTRWEHGTLGMLVSIVPGMFFKGFSGKGKGVLFLAMDMLVPPLALLAMLLCTGFGFSVAWYFFSDSLLAAGLFLLQLVLFFLAVLLAWWRFGRDLVSPSELMMLPSYVLGKLPIYARFLVKRQVEWIRSKRDAD